MKSLNLFLIWISGLAAGILVREILLKDSSLALKVAMGLIVVSSIGRIFLKRKLDKESDF